MSKITEAAEELSRAKSDHKRASERMKAATVELVQLMLAERLAQVTSGSTRFELRCPEPAVKLTFVGREE